MREPVKKIRRLKQYHRTHYAIKFQLGLIFSLSIFLVAFKINIASEPPQALILEMPEEVFIEEVVQTKQITTPPPPPRPPVPIEVPNDEVIEDEILALDLEFDMDGPMDLPPPPPPASDGDEHEIFIVVEQPPVLIGGIASVQKRIKYPELARNAGIEGRVVLQFVVTKEGEVANPKVVRGIGGGCDEAALEALKFAKFKPGYQRGRPVNVSYSLPITFTLGPS
ncbi:MAG: energy transducer TonB [Balneolaceae bacterium]|nr:energy transducer TonB [Balneolaceae bacterium]